MNSFSNEHEKVREKYGTTDQANYWLEVLDTTKLDNFMIEMIENSSYFFLATASKDGKVNVNFKGSDNNKLLKVINQNTLIFPDFTGNGILHSIGDIQSNPNVGLLIIDFCNDRRIKINGKATIIDDKEMIISYLDIFDSFEIERLIKVDIEYVLPNCSNKLHVVRDEILNKEKI